MPLSTGDYLRGLAPPPTGSPVGPWTAAVGTGVGPDNLVGPTRDRRDFTGFTGSLNTQTYFANTVLVD